MWNSDVMQRGASIIVSAIVCIIVVYGAHFHLIPSNFESEFNPAETCTQPPLGCWDGLNKKHYKCITYDTDTEIRKGVTVKAGTKNCYKSIYFNLDQNTMFIFIWLLVWTMITSRAIENIVYSFLRKTVRFPIMFAILVSIPVLWYVCSVPMHYINDRYYLMFNSQMFFTFSEIYCYIVCILHLDKERPVYPWLVLVMNGTAVAHIIQFCLDEPFIFTSTIGTSIRNMLFLSGDVMVLYAGLSLCKNQYRKILKIAAAEIIVFQIFFADYASFSISKKS